MKRLVVAPVLALLAATAPARAEGEAAESGMTLEEVTAALEAEAIEIEVTDTHALAASGWGYEFNVEGVNCSAARCTEFVLIAGYDLPDGMPLERINDWNREHTAGRAFLDENGDPFLDHIVSVSGPGDAGALTEALYLWLSALEDFNDFLDQAENTA